MSAPDKILKGKLLLDGGELSGSFFHHTVILICDHSAEGAFGFGVETVRAAARWEKLVVADLPVPLKESPLFLGGPVQPTALSFLHADNFIPTQTSSQFKPGPFAG